jgi:hypothetical protein
MSWMNASDYVLIESMARDRVAELQAATDAPEQLEAPCAPSGTTRQTETGDGWRRSDVTTDRRAGQATLRRRLGVCAS